MNVRRPRPAGGLPVIVTLILPAALALANCGGAGAPSSPAAGPAAPAPASDVVTLTPEEMQSGGITVDVPRDGVRTTYVTVPAVLQLDESRTARVGALVDGVVVNTPVQIGARVRRGARLASLHSHMVHEARAEYRRALADERRATTELAFAKEAEGRAVRLLAAKAASRQEVERAETDRAAAEEALVIARSEIRRSLDELEHLGLESGPDTADDPGDTVPIHATIGGVVLERLVTVGTAVTTGTPLFVVSDVSHLWAIAEIDETRLSAVSAGGAVALTVTAHPGRSFGGRVLATGESVNPETRRVTVRIEVENAAGLLKPQMFASVQLPGGEERPVLTVPSTALQKVDQEPVVFIEEEPGRFRLRRVTPGPEGEGQVEIHDGLAGGERVAVSGTFLLKSRFLETGQPE